MVERHEEFICRVLSSSPRSPLRIVFDILIILALIFAHGLQYRHTLKARLDEANPLPRSYIIGSALFALFQLCDYLVDDTYGVWFEARCPGALTGWRFLETTGGIWVLSAQMLGAVGLCVVCTIQSSRDHKQREEDTLTDDERGGNGISQDAQAEENPTEESPLLSPSTHDDETLRPSQPEPITTSTDLSYLSLPTITITTLLLLLLLIFLPPGIGIGTLILAFGLLSILGLMVLPLLPLPRCYEYAANLTSTVLVIVLAISLPALYFSTLAWPDRENGMTMIVIRMPVLFFSSLFLVLQYPALLRLLFSRPGNAMGLGLKAVGVMVAAHIGVLASLIARCERRWRVERMWCEQSARNPGWWASCEVEGNHVWESFAFWVFSAQGRMGYSVVVMGVVAGLMVWKGRMVETREGGEEEERNG